MPRVAIVGGGLAGLAAAAALAKHGCLANIWESRRSLGGRAGSFREADGVPIDHCQHVGMACCTNLLDLCRQADASSLFRRDAAITFFDSAGRPALLQASRWLPAPFHLAPSFLRMRFLSWSQRLSIARNLFALARLRPEQLAGRTIGAWLTERGESPAARDRFWSIVLVSALGETLENASLAAAQKVMVDGFLAHREAYQIECPVAPLAELYDVRLGEYLQQRGVLLQLGQTVERIEGDAAGATSLLFRDGRQLPVDAVILAAPWRRASGLLAPALLAAAPGLEAMAKVGASPISAVHLWLDRRLTTLPHAVLLERLSQWVFLAGSRPTPGGETGEYHQVVISASRDLRGRDKQQILEEVLQDLRATWPAKASFTVKHWRIVTQPEAVFSLTPECETLRPPQATSVPNLYLAGDWTQTGWPSTMEGAVRSGRLAAEALLAWQGVKVSLLTPDLPRNGLVRWLVGP
ncbi:hydroxysqualene dehydroxylase HpnE [Lignipirellula cremea]|uniref:15-cis-phytoene desaturase n=1 Tax=Lignipirellula cremea TaxID=2528010 RepID=A0A518DN51_9BACT|nr:hydroxysqualene dehydroxylase HpnE [Lignipirellula cremea]QDU93251.1 15-cis-phytoene desaturase [Lignipirellula cremea]